MKQIYVNDLDSWKNGIYFGVELSNESSIRCDIATKTYSYSQTQAEKVLVIARDSSRDDADAYICDTYGNFVYGQIIEPEYT